MSDSFDTVGSDSGGVGDGSEDVGAGFGGVGLDLSVVRGGLEGVGDGLGKERGGLEGVGDGLDAVGIDLAVVWGGLGVDGDDLEIEGDDLGLAGEGLGLVGGGLGRVIDTAYDPRHVYLHAFVSFVNVSLGEEFFAEEALFAVAAAGGAVLAAVEDDLEVEFVPGVSGEEFFEVVFGLCDVFALGEFPTFGEAVDVCIDGEGGDAEGLGHDDGSGFMSDAGELFEVGEGGGDLAVMLVNEDVAEFGDGEGLGGGEAAGADDGLDLFDGDEPHFFRGVGEGEEGGGDLVDADVGALGGEEDGDEEGVGAGVVEGDGCFRVELVEAEEEVVGALLFPHVGMNTRAGGGVQGCVFHG